MRKGLENLVYSKLKVPGVSSTMSPMIHVVSSHMEPGLAEVTGSTVTLYESQDCKRCHQYKEPGSHHLLDVGCAHGSPRQGCSKQESLMTTIGNSSGTTWLSSPQVVLQNLITCLILFYSVYYVSLSMCCLTLQVYELDVLAPFDFKTNPSWLNTNYKVLLFSTEVTYFVCGLLFALVVEEWVWDYAISVTILHVALTSTVMLEFPLTAHWWAALGMLELF
ncbi:putative transmembrane protein 244 [Urocitellus parryii]